MLTRFFNKLFEEALLTAIVIIVLVLSIGIKTPDLKVVDYRVIGFLMMLMLIAIGFEKVGFLDAIAVKMIKRGNTEKRIAIYMSITTAILAMLVTNDVALLTVVPITLVIARKGGFNPYKIVVIEAIAANFGGSLTPIGNPQNIFLYHYYNLELVDFIVHMMPFFSVCFGLTLLMIAFMNNDVIQYEANDVRIKSWKKLCAYGVLMLIALSTITHVMPFYIAFIVTLLVVLIIDRESFLRVDYALLLTFVFFFIAIDQLDFMISSLSGINSITLVSVALSQFISNVPTAIALSPLTTDAYRLTLGVSIGGFSTMIASLANLIAYKLYLGQFKNKKLYLTYFYKLNLIFLIVLLIVFA